MVVSDVCLSWSPAFVLLFVGFYEDRQSLTRVRVIVALNVARAIVETKFRMTNQKTIWLGIAVLPNFALGVTSGDLGYDSQRHQVPQSEFFSLFLTSRCSSRHCNHVCSCISRRAAAHPIAVPADSSPTCLNYLKSYRNCLQHSFESKGKDFRGRFKSAGGSLASDFVGRFGHKQGNGEGYLGHEHNGRAGWKNDFFRSM